MTRFSSRPPIRTKFARSVSCSTVVDYEIVTLEAWPHADRARRNRLDVRRERAAQGRCTTPAATGELTVAEDSGLAIDALGRRARRRVGALRRRRSAVPGEVRADRRGAAREGRSRKPGALRLRAGPGARARRRCSKRAAPSKAASRRSRAGPADSATTRSSSTRRTARRSRKPATPRPPSAIAAKRSAS